MFILLHNWIIRFSFPYSSLFLCFILFLLFIVTISIFRIYYLHNNILQLHAVSYFIMWCTKNIYYVYMDSYIYTHNIFIYLLIVYTFCTYILHSRLFIHIKLSAIWIIFPISNNGTDFVLNLLHKRFVLCFFFLCYYYTNNLDFLTTFY